MSELKKWMVENNVPEAMRVYVNRMKNSGNYGFLAGLFERGSSLVEVTLENGRLQMESAECLNEEITKLIKKEAKLRRELKDARAELNEAKKMISAQKEEIKSLTPKTVEIEQ